MPAPKLLPKKTINAELATQRKQDIDKGLKLTKAIEALRDTKGQEERDLEEFRRKTTARVQIEIDQKIAERESIGRDIIRLKEERVLAQAPINLREEWQKVREDKVANTTWQDRNTEQSLDLLARENEVQERTERLDKEEDAIRDEHTLSLRTLQEAEAKFAQADQVLERAEQSAQATLQTAQEAANRVRIREEDATIREVSLSQREQEVQVHETDLSNREIKLRSRQETFLKAQAYIKRNKK